jgi:hypothetical protein
MASALGKTLGISLEKSRPKKSTRKKAPAASVVKQQAEKDELNTEKIKRESEATDLRTLIVNYKQFRIPSCQTGGAVFDAIPTRPSAAAEQLSPVSFRVFLLIFEGG